MDTLGMLGMVDCSQAARYPGRRGICDSGRGMDLGRGVLTNRYIIAVYVILSFVFEFIHVSSEVTIMVG